MTQEDKELLLKDLCARLPYKVKILDIPANIVGNLSVISTTDIIEYEPVDEQDDNWSQTLYNIKPYLFPFSSMTEEQKKEWHSLMICELYGILHPTIESFDYLYKNHIDIRGLIPKGLANDATGLNIY